MVLRFERGLVDARDGEAECDFADFGAELVKLVRVGSEEVGVGFGSRSFSVVGGLSGSVGRGFSGSFVSAGGFDANVGDLSHPGGDLLHFGGAEATSGNSGRS